MATTTSTTSTSDTVLNQLHPAVYSQITADQSTFSTSSGVITLFSADTFEKGPDNVIGFVGSSDEFLFKYGNPNYTKYGQGAYNILNFLKAGGQAFVQRILPDDASYAHGIVNIQSKVTKGSKTVMTSKGTTVTMDDVFLRPTTAFVEKNNIDLEMLLGELSRDRSTENTVDGYANNFLMLVYPFGRGESYNNLGFRISLNKSYDTTNSSRVYNFEVIQFDDNSSTHLVEGPFYVSFDENASSETSTSMYIEDVINTQSNYLKVAFNQDTYNKVASLVNPKVNPGRIDILTGQTSKSFAGGVSTFFDSVSGENQDVHISLQKYTSNGNPVTVNGTNILNIPTSTDTVQQALINLDNGLRESNYNIDNNKLSYMRSLFPKLRSDNFNEFNLAVAQLVSVTPASADGNTPAKISGDIPGFISTVLNADSSSNSLYAKFLAAKQAYTAKDSVENLNTFTSFADKISEQIQTVYLDKLNQLFSAYSLTLHDSPNPSLEAEYQLNVKKILDEINEKNQVSIFTVEHQGAIYEIQKTIVNYQLGTVSGSTLDGISLILNNVETEINYVYDSLLPVAYGSYKNVPAEILSLFDPKSSTSIVSSYNSNLTLLADIQHGLMANNADNRDLIYSSCTEITNSLLEVISKVTFEANGDTITSAVATCSNDLLTDAKSMASAVSSMITPQGTYDKNAILDNARSQVDIMVSNIASTSSKFFNTNLIDFSNSIKLLMGSDGAFTYDNAGNNSNRTDAINQQLVKAYSGVINPAILDTDKYRFDLVLDARYSNDVKLAITNLARTTRKDFLFIADTAGPEFPASPDDVIAWRHEKFNVSSEYAAIYSQDLTYYDEFTGKDIRFTPTYVMASKIPTQAVQTGLHYPIAGPRRGVVDGFKDMSWSPNNAYKELLYANNINYIQQDAKITRFNAQNTSINTNGPLSQLNNMFTILDIKRNVQDLVSNYIFEFNDSETRDSLYTALNNYLTKYTSNRSCQSISAEVSTSDYDIQQRILRVNISIQFTGVIERIMVNLSVEQ